VPGKRVLTVFIVLATMVVFIEAQDTATRTGAHRHQVPDDAVPLLWGNLRSGSYGVGSKTLFRFDGSRTWLSADDRNGRPIRIQVWYPTLPTRTRQRMSYGEYIHFPAPKPFAALEQVLEQRDETLAAQSVAKGELPALLSTRMDARRDSPPVRGRFPTLFYFGGLNDTTTAGAILAEYLASHGFVVVSVPLLGVTASDPSQHRTQSGLEATVRDAEFAWSVVRSETYADSTRLGVIGHSLGGIEAVLFAMRNANVRAVVALDGTYGFAGATEVLTNFYGYAPQRMTAALLDLRKAAGEQDTVLDLSALNDFHYAPRLRVTITKMHHSDFASFGMIAKVFELGNDPGYVDPSGWTRANGAEQFQHACGITEDFLEEYLLGSNNAANRIPRDVANALGGTDTFQPGMAPPPSPDQLIVIATQQGMQAVDAVIDRYRREVPIDWIVEERTFNALGYKQLAAHRIDEAIAAFRVNTYAHPRSANTFDSLADGYITAEKPELATEALRAAIETAKDDPTFVGGAKDSFISQERTKLERLKAPK
jgi:dienelactone hydrolase